MSPTSAGTAANDITCSIPYACAGAFEDAIGSFHYLDSGVGYIEGTVILVSASVVGFRVDAAGSVFGQATTIASGDRLSFTVHYESTT